MRHPEPTFERPLPTSPDAERFVLGAILGNGDLYPSVAGVIEASDFASESHRRVFLRMGELYERRERIDRVTLYEELARCDQAQAVGGLSGLLALEEGMPRPANPDSYARIVKEKARLRAIVLTSQRTLDKALNEESPSHVIASAATEDFIGFSGETGQNGGLRTFSAFTDSFPGGLQGLLSPGPRSRGVQTGIYKLDEVTGGLRPGEMIVLAARPAMGKTALALNIARNVAVDAGVPVGFWSLEMSEQELWTRLLCSEARVSLYKFRAGFVNERERRELLHAANRLAKAPIHIDDTANLGPIQLYNKARKAKAEFGLGLVIVDYLQLMNPPRAENRVQEVSVISRGLKIMAKELKLPLVALSQLSRACESREDKRPQLSDLRESGSLEQDPDIVGFVFRPEVYEPQRADLRGQAELIIAKQRNGPVGRINLVFVKDYTKFENSAGDVPEPAEPDHNWQEPEED